MIYAGVDTITSVHFRPSLHHRHHVLFITTRNHVMCMTIGGKEKDSNLVRSTPYTKSLRQKLLQSRTCIMCFVCVQNILDQHGCFSNCSVMTQHQIENQLIIGREEVVTCNIDFSSVLTCISNVSCPRAGRVLLPARRPRSVFGFRRQQVVPRLVPRLLDRRRKRQDSDRGFRVS